MYGNGMTMRSWNGYFLMPKKACLQRGMLDAISLMKSGLAPVAALDMGMTNKTFDPYEQTLVRDVIAARIPAGTSAGEIFAG